jgi:hypothetical protein
MNLQKLIHILIGIIWIGALPKARAVVPPPDGGYPNFNTAEGTKALFSLTAGSANTAVGWFSLGSLNTGSFNTATGAGALLFNTADNNTASGAAALLFNTTGSDNTAVGAAALINNNDGNFNTAVGSDALFSNTTGGANTAYGRQALKNNSEGSFNTAIGHQALVSNSGDGNTAVGYEALRDNTTGQNNIALGYFAGVALTTGDSNIDIARFGVAGESNTIRIGDESVQTATYIAGISGRTASGGVAVFVNSNGKLGTSTSSARFKEEIKPMGEASEAILALKPVSFRYKKELDPGGIPQFGLVAEEVEKVNPDLVARDKEGKPYTVRYDQVNAMLLNEFLKEHREVQELEATVSQQRKDFEATITELKKEMESVVARSKEQDAKIQNVGAQVEMNKAATQTVANR